MSQKTDAFRTDDSTKPYTHLNFKNDPDKFQFAIITDNAGAGPAPASSPRRWRWRICCTPNLWYTLAI